MEKTAVKEIEEVKVKAHAKMGRKSIMEVHIKRKGVSFVQAKYINEKELLEMGVIKRSGSCNKAEKWLNTPEGMKWVDTEKEARLF